MALKQQDILTRADFESSLRHRKVRMSVSEVAKALGIPRAYLSEFRSGERNLKPEFQEKLRAFFEEKGVEFDDAPAPQTPNPDAPHTALAVARICHLPIRADRVSEAPAILDEMGRNDVRIAELLDKPAIRNSGLFGDGDFSEETVEDLKELFAFTGASYMLFRYLTLDKNPLDQVAGQYTLRSVLIEHLKQSFDAAGLNTAPPQPEPVPEEEPA